MTQLSTASDLSGLKKDRALSKALHFDTKRHGSLAMRIRLGLQLPVVLVPAAFGTPLLRASCWKNALHSLVWTARKWQLWALARPSLFHRWTPSAGGLAAEHLLAAAGLPVVGPGHSVLFPPVDSHDVLSAIAADSHDVLSPLRHDVHLDA